MTQVKDEVEDDLVFETKWQSKYWNSVEKYIKSIDFSNIKDEYQRTLIIGNMQGMAGHLLKDLGDLPNSLIQDYKEHMSKDEVGEWKKKFDALFAVKEFIYNEDMDTYFRVGENVDARDIKSFIKSLLKKQSATLIEKVEGIRRRFVTEPAKYKGSDANVYREGFNSAIDDILAIIKG